jgi:hypothetical protein
MHAQAVERYAAFVALHIRHPGTFLVPTYDIDLVGFTVVSCMAADSTRLQQAVILLPYACTHVSCVMLSYKWVTRHSASINDAVYMKSNWVRDEQEVADSLVKNRQLIKQSTQLNYHQDNNYCSCLGAAHRTSMI